MVRLHEALGPRQLNRLLVPENQHHRAVIAIQVINVFQMPEIQIKSKNEGAFVSKVRTDWPFLDTTATPAA